MNKKFSDLLRVYDNAIIFDSPSVVGGSPSNNTPSKRDFIKSFSLASVRRLREALAVYYIPDSLIVGVTLTVPWRKSFDGYLSVYRASFNRFCTSLRRDYPTIGGVFRHELQTRKMPHCHMLFYIPSSIDIVSFSASVTSLWLRSCPCLDGSASAFGKYGVLIKPIYDQPSIFKYLADHTSKHKQSQLGYQGKQWGYFKRSNLVKRKSDVVSLSPFDTALLRRYLSRVYRYTKKSDCVFGYKHLRRRKNAKVCFYSPSVVFRLISYIKKIKKN